MLRQPTLLFYCLILALPCSKAADKPAVVPQSFPREGAATKIPAASATLPPHHCDLNGLFYARTIQSSDGKSFGVVRFGKDQKIERTYVLDTWSDPTLKDYAIVDYAPDPAAGLYAIAIRAATKLDPHPRRVVLHFDEDGTLGGTVPFSGFRPKKMAVFSNGTILAAGPRLDTSDLLTTTSPWYSGIFRPDGTLLKELNFQPSVFLSTAPAGDPHSREHTASIRTPEVESGQGLDWDAIVDAIRFVPSPMGNIYAALSSSLDAQAFASTSTLLEISPSGSITKYPIPVPENAELFDIVVSPNHVFAMFGNRHVGIDDLREFSVDSGQRILRLIARYRILGAPQCATDDQLVVLRPDGKGGISLIIYSVP